MAVSKTFKSTSLAIVIALGVEISIAQAQTAKAVNYRSTITVRCFDANSKKAQSETKTCNETGSAKTFTKTTIGGEDALIVEGSKGLKCVITDALAKKNKIPLSFLIDMVRERRFELDCGYQTPVASENSAATTFYIRAFLE